MNRWIDRNFLNIITGACCAWIILCTFATYMLISTIHTVAQLVTTVHELQIQQLQQADKIRELKKK